MTRRRVELPHRGRNVFAGWTDSERSMRFPRVGDNPRAAVQRAAPATTPAPRDARSTPARTHPCGSRTPYKGCAFRSRIARLEQVDGTWEAGRKALRPKSAAAAGNPSPSSDGPGGHPLAGEGPDQQDARRKISRRHLPMCSFFDQMYDEGPRQQNAEHTDSSPGWTHAEWHPDDENKDKQADE